MTEGISWSKEVEKFFVEVKEHKTHKQCVRETRVVVRVRSFERRALGLAVAQVYSSAAGIRQPRDVNDMRLGHPGVFLSYGDCLKAGERLHRQTRLGTRLASTCGRKLGSTRTEPINQAAGRKTGESSLSRLAGSDVWRRSVECCVVELESYRNPSSQRAAFIETEEHSSTLSVTYMT